MDSIRQGVTAAGFGLPCSPCRGGARLCTQLVAVREQMLKSGPAQLRATERRLSGDREEISLARRTSKALSPDRGQPQV